LIQKKSKVGYSDEYGYIKDSWKAYSYGSNHVVMKVTCKTVLWDYPTYSSYYNYKIDFKKISKKKLKIKFTSKYSSYSHKVTTKKSAVSYYKKYYKKFVY